MAKTIDLRKRTNFPLDQSYDKPISLGLPIVANLSWVGLTSRYNPNPKIIWPLVIIIWISAATLQFFRENIITTIFFSLLGLMILILAKKKPPITKIELSATGITIGDQSYPYRELKSFWLDYQPDYRIKEVSLHFKKWYLPYIKIPIGEQNPVQIRSFLVEFIPEVEHEETFADVLGRKLGL